MQRVGSQKCMKTIAVDIDDVLAAHSHAFAKWSNEKYGTNITNDDYQESWQEVWKIEYEETIKRAEEYHESDHLFNCEIIEGAYEALKKLKERFKLVAITSRRDSISELTTKWINVYYPDIFDEIVFAGFFNKISSNSLKLTKGELAKNIGVNFIIDDQLKHILSAAELGIQAILFGNYNWNKADSLPKNAIRANDWSDVIKYFESK